MKKMDTYKTLCSFVQDKKTAYNIAMNYNPARIMSLDKRGLIYIGMQEQEADLFLKVSSFALLSQKERGTDTITSSRDIYNYVIEDYMGLPHEELKVLLLNHSHKVIDLVLIGKGGISAAVCDIRLLIHEAIIGRATSIAIIHNHPSGCLKPSDADREIFKNLREACKVFGILLLDSLIVTDESYLSFADHGIF